MMAGDPNAAKSEAALRGPAVRSAMNKYYLFPGGTVVLSELGE
jgi:hypothetical protein